MRMRGWPEDGSTLRAEDVIAPFVDALRFMYRLERQNEGVDVPWDGPDAEGACYPPPSVSFTAEQLAYGEEDQGRTPDEVLVEKVFQAGVEQGQRMQRKDNAQVLKIVARYLKETELRASQHELLNQLLPEGDQL